MTSAEAVREGEVKPASHRERASERGSEGGSEGGIRC